MGTFFNNFLPTMVGGDIYKTYTLTRETGDAASVLAATFLERFLGLTALVSLLPLIMLHDAINTAVPMLNLILIGILASYIFLLALIVSPVFDYFGSPPPRLKIIHNAWRFASSTHSILQRFKGFGGTLLWSYGISLIFYLFVAGTILTAAMSLGVQIDFLYLLAITPIILLAASAPISLNGLGVAEAGYVVFFQLIGISAEDAFGIALILRMRLLVTALLGGLIFLRPRTHAQAPDTTITGA